MSNFNALKSELSLPLVNYAGQYQKPYDFESLNLDESYIPKGVIKDVLAANFDRRREEALSGFMTKLYQDMSADEQSHYIETMAKQAGGDQSREERAERFVSGAYMNGYEISARTRIHQRDLFDISFAQDSLSRIAANQELKSHDSVEPFLPKLRRVISKGPLGEFAVIGAKIEAGNLFADDEFMSLKSRQTGVVARDTLDHASWKVIRALSALPEHGAEEVRDAIRGDLRDMLIDNPDFAQPIVESQYLARS